ncbi:Hypothetical protein I5071_26040 [Sandaracinus amylolyticus]|nr:Hypothetical protein I5071_26040 [Sandaracinus amylolyticus]
MLFVSAMRAWVIALALCACGTPCQDAWIGANGCPSECYVLSARPVDVERACTLQEEVSICARADQEPVLAATCVVDEETGTRWWAVSGVSLGRGWRACTEEEEGEVGEHQACEVDSRP